MQSCATQVFQRNEKKYRVSAAAAHCLMQQLRPYIQPDEYGRYSICSLYFDTADFACYRTQLQKPAFREKLRLRSYGVPTAEDTVFFELKKKYGGVSFKRRMALALCEANHYINAGIPPAGNCQVFSEIDAFKSRLQLQPTVLVAYNRIAFVGLEDPGLRITFDTNLRWRHNCLNLQSGAWGRPALPPGEVLLEIKTIGALPIWLSHILSGEDIFPASFSKFATVTGELLQERNCTHAE